MVLRIYRRHMPHWRLEGATYWVTWCLHRNQPTLLPAERDLVVSVLRHFEGQRFALDAFVVMDDHVHLVVTPMPRIELEQIVHSWKSVSAWRLQREHGRRGAVWHNEYHDRIVRNDGELAQKIRYLQRNPAGRWPGIDGYPWVWWRGAPGARPISGLGTEARPTPSSPARPTPSSPARPTPSSPASSPAPPASP
jgi:REP element-mobilizing transposase RayT